MRGERQVFNLGFFKGRSKSIEDANKGLVPDHLIEMERKKREEEEQRKEAEERRRKEEEERRRWEHNKKIEQSIYLANSWGETPEEREKRKKKNDWLSGW